MTNPYAGNEPYGTAWQQGYDYAQANPNEQAPQTPDFSSWGYDQQTTSYVGQVWQEGALAGGASGLTGGGQGGQAAQGSAAASGQSGGGDANASQLPHYDAESDTLYVDPEEFPALTALAQAGDFDTWLQGLGIDPSIFADDQPTANA